MPDGTAPSLVKTIIAGYAGIPRQEPIILDLTDLGVHNGNVGRIRDVIETNFDPVRQRVTEFVAGQGGGDDTPTADQLREWRTTVSAIADDKAGYSYPTYLRLRLRAVLDGFARMIITRQEYQPASAQALFVQRVLSEWAEGQEVFAKTPRATDLQRKLIDTLDLARLERQVRFLIAALSWWYKPSDEERQRVPDRQQLDQAKHDLYRLIDELNGLARLLVEDEEIRQRVDQVFGRAVLVPPRAPTRSIATSPITPTSSPSCRASSRSPSARGWRSWPPRSTRRWCGSPPAGRRGPATSCSPATSASPSGTSSSTPSRP